MDFSALFLKKNKEKTKINTFAQALFANMDWHFSEEASITQEVFSVSEKKSPSTREVLIQSLETFVKKELHTVKETPEKVFRFPGGELRFKEETQEKVVKDVVHYGETQNWCQTLDGCSRCDQKHLSKRQQVVHDWKRLDLTKIKILFVSDYPRTAQDHFFTGETGELFARMVKAMQLQSEDFALSLGVKCYPAEEEFFSPMMETCNHYLFSEIFQLRPKLVVTLGAFMSHYLLGKKNRLSSIHGQFFDKTIETSQGDQFSFKIVPLFHPEYLQINPSMKQVAWDDMKKIIAFLAEK